MFSAQPGSAPDPAVVEVRISARAALIPTVRTVASDLAARADFDLDAISDLRMAVDEACSTLVGLSTENSTLTCIFVLKPDRIEVTADTDARPGGAAVNTDSFGWRVLQTLADEVIARHAPGVNGKPDQIGINLTKSTSAAP